MSKNSLKSLKATRVPKRLNTGFLGLSVFSARQRWQENINTKKLAGVCRCTLVLSRLAANLVASLDKQVQSQFFKTLEFWDPEDSFFLKSKISPKMLVSLDFFDMKKPGLLVIEESFV